MTDSGPSRIGVAFDIKPHVYDPIANPELFEGVLSRRIVAFVIDLIILAVPVLLAAIFILVFGIVTFGLGWVLFWLMWPATVVWAVFYYGWSFGGPASATYGMRAMELEMRTWYGAPAYFLLGAVHGVVYWISVSMLTPFVLVVGLFNARRRLLHDMLVGTVVINNSGRGAALRSRSGR
jgi:uncharacterized RDD family membrane protein YckC